MITITTNMTNNEFYTGFKTMHIMDFMADYRHKHSDYDVQWKKLGEDQYLNVLEALKVAFITDGKKLGISQGELNWTFNNWQKTAGKTAKQIADKKANKKGYYGR